MQDPDTGTRSAFRFDPLPADEARRANSYVLSPSVCACATANFQNDPSSKPSCCHNGQMPYFCNPVSRTVAQTEMQPGNDFAEVDIKVKQLPVGRLAARLG